MTVYRRGRIWHYRFRFQKRRYRGSTLQTDYESATLVEAKRKLELRLQAGGLARPQTRSPRFADWADIYCTEMARRVDRIDRVEHLLRVVLRFWGERPTTPAPVAYPTPYHNLCLEDPVRDPEWIVAFEQWMADRGVAGQTRNQYRSVLSGLYKLAMQPAWREKTGVTSNPFLGLFRDPPAGREVIVTADELRRLLEQASYHVRLALSIGILAPMLRLSNILALQWRVHLDPDLQYITVRKHKTARHTRRPLAIPVSVQLRRILEDARRRAPGSPYVVTYRGQPVKTVRGGLQAAARRAGLPYGRFCEDGVTFHTLRHSAATSMAEREREAVRQQVLGHEHPATTAKYTHLRPVDLAAPVERLSAAFAVDDLVMASWRRARNPRPPAGGTSASPPGTKLRQSANS